MNKRIISILLSLVMIMSMLITAVPVLAADTVEFKVSADKTTANPGDTVNFSVSIGAVDNFGVLEFHIIVPAGLTIVDSSVKIPDGVPEAMDSDGPIVLPAPKNNYKWSYSAQSTGYTSNTALVILTFSCTVDNDCTLGDKDITISMTDCYTNNVVPQPYTITKETVKIEAAPVAVTGVTIDETLSVNIGQTKTPSFTVAPAEATNKTVSFTSNNPAVATVNATTGAVTGVSKGTATITVKTVDGNFTDTCAVTVSCAHSYTAETKKAEALKTAGNCRDKAVYYYSCAVCGNVEHDDAHTFLGDKDANTHVGSTSIVNASEPDHKNQVNGYTGDTKCLGCGEIIATGTSIPAGAHTPSSTWNSDGTYHWKECTTMGCGVVIDGSKAKHSSTGANVATCQHKAICDVCGVEYDELAEHNPASSWTSDASGHWHACQTANCTEKCDFAAHTPDHTGHATEEYAIKCTECGYVIEAQLSHTHVFDKEVATEAYKASDATCTAKATYYKSCACGEKGTATFEYGTLAAHDPASSWTSDASGHWHACQTAGCTEKCDFAAHTPDHEGHATEEYAIKCTECGYVIEAQLSHTHVFDKEVATEAYKATDATCTAKATYYKSCACGEKGTATFEYGELADHNWMPATCTAPKTCNTCRATEGDPLGHDYTKKVENNTYLKTAASNCKEHNVYWYACSRCDANAKDDVAATDKYYTGTTAGNHSFTEKIEDAAHYVAGTGTTCQNVKKYYYDCAYCDQIGTTTWNSTTYGPHDYDTVWSNDKSGHWHECSLCHDKKDEAAHTPGAAATETTPQKCTECDYIITAALGHTHRMTSVAANPVTCTEDGNTAYYVCSGCSKWYEDAAGNVEITDHSSVVRGALGHNWKAATCTAPKTCNTCGATEGDPLGHSEGTEWKYDSENHWHTCTVAGCGVVIDSSKAAHTPDRAAATETDPVKCSVCGYVITPASGHTHDVDTTKYESDETNHWNTCSGCGEKQNVSAHEFEWKIDKDATATEKGSKHEECKVCGYRKAAVEIPATGTPTDPTPENPDSPQTGDNSMIGLWIALLFASGAGVAGTTAYSRKRRRAK